MSQDQPARSRPRDAEIIDVLALAFNVSRSVAAEWGLPEGKIDFALATGDAKTTLLHAAELLEADAKEWRDGCNADPDNPAWRIGSHARAAYDDALCTALELRLLAKSIQDGKAAVSPAPTI